MKQIEVNLLKSLGQGDESHRIPSTAHISSMPGGWGGGVFFIFCKHFFTWGKIKESEHKLADVGIKQNY